MTTSIIIIIKFLVCLLDAYYKKIP